MCKINTVEDMNILFDNENNIYYGHGTAISVETIKDSIFKIGLRCSHGNLSSTTLPLELGKNLTADSLLSLETWEHRGSDKVVIVSLPFKKYDWVTGNPDDLPTAYYHYPEEKKGIDKRPYLMPQFIKGYYDKDTKEFIENPSYYENLSKEEQEELFDQVRKNLYNNIKERHEITSKNYTGRLLEPQPSMSIIEYIRFLESNNREIPFTTEEVGIDWAMEVWNKLKDKGYQTKKAKLPNGIEVPVHQYLTEYFSQFIQPNGKFKLKTGVNMSVQQFVEEYVLDSLGQEKYNGEIEKLISDYCETKKNNNEIVGSIDVDENDMEQVKIINSNSEERIKTNKYEGMPTIEFGHDDAQDFRVVSYAWGLRSGLRICKGVYCGVVELDNEDLFVARVIEDDSNDPQFEGKYIVLPTLADIYADGSGEIYLNQEPSINSELVERKLNESGKDIKNIHDIKDVLPGLHATSKPIFKNVIRDNSEIGHSTYVTALTPSAFNLRKVGIEECMSNPFSELGNRMLNQNYGNVYFRQMGYAKVWILGIITALISIGVIILGILLIK